jgi:hypothetical protein
LSRDEVVGGKERDRSLGAVRVYLCVRAAEEREEKIRGLAT